MRIVYWLMAFVLVAGMLVVLNSLPAESSKGDMLPLPKLNYHKSICV